MNHFGLLLGLFLGALAVAAIMLLVDSSGARVVIYFGLAALSFIGLVFIALRKDGE